MKPALNIGLSTGSRIRLVRQTEVAECGLAALVMVVNYHRANVDLGELRRRFAPSMRGTALTTLIDLADRLGFTSQALKLPLEELQYLATPAILHWDLNHFVVLERVKGGKALIHDPAGQTRWLELREVSKHFTGIALEVEPAADFEPVRRLERMRLRNLWRRMSGLKRALLQTIVLSLVMQAFVLGMPYYMQIAVDQAVPALDGNLVLVLAFGFAFLTLVNVGASMLRGLVLLTAGTSLSFGIAANLARRLFRLPIAWFERRHVADILSRFQSIEPIQRALTEGAVASLLDGALAILILAVMFFYSAALSMIAILAFAAYALVRAVAFSYQREAQEQAIVTTAKEQSMLIESMRGIVTLRLFNRESERRSQWLSRLTDAVNSNVRLAKLTLWQESANTLIFGLEIVVSVAIAISFVIEGGFSLGMVFAFIAYKTQFLTRAASLVDRGIEFSMLRLHLERLSDIALSPQDPSFTAEPPPPRRLEGRIELRGVRFRYSASDPYVLDGTDLTVAPGDHVAITGASGGGKSTLVKILLGLLEPEAGDFLIDGQPLERFGYGNFREQVSAVLQDDNLFAGSIAANIAQFEEQPDMGRVFEAASAAAIHDDIVAMPMGYESLVGDMGSSLSGGQKQRILLARALYRRPKLIVMDEGTAHLDTATEEQVNAAISALGITRIIIAHRRETILRADRIFVASGGQLHEIEHARFR